MARDTRTRLFAFPTEIRSGDPVILIARVTPANAAGTVQFKDRNTALAPPVPVINGFAVIITTQLRTVGNHPLTATFTPTNPRLFKPSTSNTVKVEVERRR